MLKTLIKKIYKGVEQSEGVGARVIRTIGRQDLSHLDPFLLLDEFKVAPPAGFPDHPHRGFETVTYMLEGAFKHEDNSGNKGVINKGDIQWMTAGRGIVHSELPATNGVNRGLQLWVNLKAKDKMCEPGYQDMKSKDIPRVKGDGYEVTVIAGTSHQVTSKVKLKTNVLYLDVNMEKQKKYTEEIPAGYNGFVYVLSGTALFAGKQGKAQDLLQFERNKEKTILEVETKDSPVRFVVIAGEPIGEPIVRYGPFVMNTKEEILKALIDFS